MGMIHIVPTMQTSYYRRYQFTAILVAFVAGLIVALPAMARTHRHKLPPLCMPGHSRVIAADSQAEVYAQVFTVHFGKEIEWEYRACAYGHRGSYAVGGAPSGCNWNGFQANLRIALAGSMVAYEESIVPEGRDEQPVSLNGEWYIDVRNVATGKLVHRAPTGTPLEPMQHYIGVGNIVSMVLKTDGSVAWIAEDFERSARSTAYFDLGAVDKSGTHLLASGTAIDPSSLSLSVGGIRGSYTPETGPHVVYWIENGQSRSAELN